MISAAKTANSVTFIGEVPAGATVFVDCDWISPVPVEGAPKSLLIASGTCRHGDRTLALPAGMAPDAVAEYLLVNLAVRAVERISTPAQQSVAVIGEGLAASAARQLLGSRLHHTTESVPSSAIDFTGTARGIDTAMRALATLGTLVLAGERTEASIPLNLYRDAHVRGLRLLGVAPIMHAGHDVEPGARQASLRLVPPVAIKMPTVDAPLSAWYRLT